MLDYVIIFLYIFILPQILSELAARVWLYVKKERLFISWIL